MEVDDAKNQLEIMIGKTKDEEDRKKLQSYVGEDKIISSEEYLKYVQSENVLYKAGSGIHGLDKIIGGFRPGTLIIVSGPTKEGKTTFCQTLTANFTKQDYKCLWFSFDTPPIEVIERFGDSLPIFYLPKSNLPKKKLDWIEQRILEGILKYNVRIIFIDHLEFLTKFNDKAPNYATELSSISQSIKEIAMKYNITIFLNHHINKIGPDETPHYSHLKNSSGPAQNSDITLMVWREKKKAEFGIEYTDYSYISVQLHRRTGKIGNLRVGFKDNLLIDIEDQTRRQDF